jgi:hypothetical protein
MVMSFKEFLALCESPIMNAEDSRGDNFATRISQIMRRHDESTPLGNDHFHLDDDDEQHFYHVTNGKMDSVSSITTDDHTHQWFFKERSVDSSIPLQNFKHALNLYGHVMSDASHTKGSKHFWMNLHSKIPGVKVHVERNGEKILHSKDELKTKEPSIWGDRHSEVRLHASL